MSEIGLPRSLAGFGAFLSVGQGVQGNTTNRRRDKSTAVGRGAYGWLDWIFLSAPAHALLPLDVKILRKSTVTAPSYPPKPTVKVSGESVIRARRFWNRPRPRPGRRGRSARRPGKVRIPERGRAK